MNNIPQLKPMNSLKNIEIDLMNEKDKRSLDKMAAVNILQRMLDSMQEVNQRILKIEQEEAEKNKKMQEQMTSGSKEGNNSSSSIDKTMEDFNSTHDKNNSSSSSSSSSILSKNLQSEIPGVFEFDQNTQNMVRMNSSAADQHAEKIAEEKRKQRLKKQAGVDEEIIDLLW
eukprot:gb/GECH01009123.1/.p1 GENE.gb/GECH01009123.1/~~gb/GECH01009123.1/.p1  ORF type:complete len:171 (+),score=59.68 gb/GECH01009123.1/:1-513(+)